MKSDRCYACGTAKGEPRDVGGSWYCLCDPCWYQHLTANAQATEMGRRQLVRNKFYPSVERLHLTREEEQELARQCHFNPTAREKLVIAHLPLVYKIARKYHRPGGLPLEDMVQEGIIGLIKAIDDFDPGRGYRVASYAYYRIASYIQRAVERSTVVHIPATAAEKFHEFRRRLKVSTPDAAAQAMGRKVEHFTAIEQALFASSLDQPACDGGENIVNLLVDPDRAGDFEEVETRVAMKQLLGLADQHLSDRERMVLLSRLASQSYKDIGASLGVSEMRVRQIEAGAMAKLREVVEDDHRKTA